MKLSSKISCAKLALMLSTVLKQIKLLQYVGIFPSKFNCDHCDNDITDFEIECQKVVFTCGICERQYRIRKNTILEYSRLSNRRWLLLTFSFIKPNWTYNDGNIYDFVFL